MINKLDKHSLRKQLLTKRRELSPELILENSKKIDQELLGLRKVIKNASSSIADIKDRRKFFSEYRKWRKATLALLRLSYDEGRGSIHKVIVGHTYQEVVSAFSSYIKNTYSYDLSGESDE